ncbi:MAG: hypothetical protein RBT65_14555 [Methanolobus sp.]|nr:hypothetical protein [Methanolobus sp.]
MDNKTKKELGFSMNEVDENTILIEGVVQRNVSKKVKMKYEREFSKISLHLFDKEYIEKLQEIEFESVSRNKAVNEKLNESFTKIAKFLMR